MLDIFIMLDMSLVYIHHVIFIMLDMSLVYVHHVRDVYNVVELV